MTDVSLAAPVHLVKGDDEVLLRDAAHRVVHALRGRPRPRVGDRGGRPRPLRPARCLRHDDRAADRRGADPTVPDRPPCGRRPRHRDVHEGRPGGAPGRLPRGPAADHVAGAGVVGRAHPEGAHRRRGRERRRRRRHEPRPQARRVDRRAGGGLGPAARPRRHRARRATGSGTTRSASSGCWPRWSARSARAPASASTTSNRSSARAAAYPRGS